MAAIARSGIASPRQDRTLALLIATAFTGVLGLAVGMAIFANAWAVDADRNLAAASALLAGRFGTDHGYVYSPLAAALTVPWTWLPHEAAIGLWLALRVAVLAVGVTIATRAWEPWARLFTFVGVALFVPTLYDLMLGNVSILLGAAIALVAWRRDSWWTGIALGIALATLPKPQLVPILVWMLAYRRQALAGTLVTGGLLTLLGVLALGAQPYAAWVDVLRSVDYLSTPMYGNLSLFGLLPTTIAVVSAMIATAAAALCLRRGPWPGLIACLALGLLVAPYTLAYAVVVVLVAARPLADAAPRASLVLALTASLGVLVALPLWLAGVVLTALLAPARRWPADA